MPQLRFTQPKLIVAAFLLAVQALAQTPFPTRIDITANPARTLGGELRVYNSTNASYGSVKYDRIVFPNLTGLYDNASGLQVWRSGLMGARATVTPGGATGSGRITLCNQDITACSGFFADPAMTTAAIYQLPGADGSSGDCLSTNGSQVLSWVACSGGGSSPPFVDSTYLLKGSVDATKRIRLEVDGLTTATDRVLTVQDKDLTIAGIDVAQTWTATQTMRDINPSVTDTYKLGDTARWYQVAANRLDGICTGCTTSTNYARTRKLEVYDQTGGTAFWYQYANTPLAGTASKYVLVDNLGTEVATFQTSDLFGISRKLYWKGNIIPGTPAATEDNTWDLGATGNKYKKLWVYDIDSANLVTGSISAVSTNINMTGTLLWSSGTNLQSSQLNLWGGAVSRLLASNGGAGGTGLLRVMNTAGDRYWGFKAASATTGTSTDWVLPTADGVSGQCMSTDGAANLSWRTCGIGTVTSISTTTPISGGTITNAGTISCPTCVTTNTTQTITGIKTFSVDIDFGTDNTYKVGGVTNRLYHVAANRFEGICTTAFTCSSSINYVTTRKLDLYDQAGNSNLFMSIRASAGLAGDRAMYFYDNAGTPMLTLERMFLLSTTNRAVFGLNVHPSADATWDLGSTGARWKDLNMSGTATIGGAVLATGNVQAGAASVFSIAGGFFGASYTGGINVGTSTLFFKGGILYACTGTC
jgi:hypothetical protein